MKDFFIKEQVVDKDILTDIHNEIINKFDNFLSQNENIGGLNSGNLNATIGKHAAILHKELLNSGLFSEIEGFFDISLKDYSLKVGCNINIPGSVKQHIHSDTHFEERIIIIRYPIIKSFKRICFSLIKPLGSST